MRISLLLVSIVLSVCAVSQGNAENVSRPVLETIPLEITTTSGNKLEFIEGEEIQFLVSLGVDAYIYMFHIDASKRVKQLLPSRYKSSHFFNKDYFLTVPDYDTGDRKGFRFIVDSPFGEEQLWIFASDSSVSLDEGLSIDAAREQIQKSADQAFGAAAFEMRTRKR